MTHSEILNMQTGRELDALIAEKVFGLEVDTISRRVKQTVFRGARSREAMGTIKETYAGGKLLPHYSTDIAAAWQVVEKFSTDPMLANDVDIITTIRGWKCTIRTNKRDYISNSDTAPLAICRAALLTVEKTK